MQGNTTDYTEQILRERQYVITIQRTSHIQLHICHYKWHRFWVKLLLSQAAYLLLLH